MTDGSMYRLAGLEPDNLLAFLALLGLLRSLEEARPASLPRVGWTIDAPPVRPALQLTERLTADEFSCRRGRRLERTGWPARFRRAPGP